MSKPIMTLEYYDWSAIHEAVRNEIDRIKESGAMHTGMGSQGLVGHVERLERVEKHIHKEMRKQDREQWLEANPQIAKEIEGIVCTHEQCDGPISAMGCTRVGCPIRAEIDAKAVWMVEGVPCEPGQEVPTYGPFETKSEADRFANSKYERYVYNAVTHPRGGRT